MLFCYQLFEIGCQKIVLELSVCCLFHDYSISYVTVCWARFEYLKVKVQTKDYTIAEMTLIKGSHNFEIKKLVKLRQVKQQNLDKRFFVKLTGHTYVLQVWQILNMKKHLQNQNCWNLAKRHPYLRWSWERTIDSIR